MPGFHVVCEEAWDTSKPKDQVKAHSCQSEPPRLPIENPSGSSDIRKMPMKNMKTEIDIEQIVERVEASGLLCIVIKEISHGLQLRFSNGAIVNAYSTGKLMVQGTDRERVKQLLGL